MPRRDRTLWCDALICDKILKAPSCEDAASDLEDCTSGEVTGGALQEFFDNTIVDDRFGDLTTICKGKTPQHTLQRKGSEETSIRKL